MSKKAAQLVKDLRNARPALFGPDWAKRIAAAQASGAQRGGEAVSDLAAVIQENQNPDLVQAALQALRQIGTPQAVDALIAILCGGDAKLRELASQLLVSLGPQVAGRSATCRQSLSNRPQCGGERAEQYGDTTPWLISLLADSDSGIHSSADSASSSSAAAVPGCPCTMNDADLANGQAVAETWARSGNPHLDH